MLWCVGFSTHSYTRNTFSLLHTNVLRYISRSSLHVLISQRNHWRNPSRSFLCPIRNTAYSCIGLRRAPVNTSNQSQPFSHVYSQLSHTNCTAMCMLICNIHYCRLAIQSTSKVCSTAVKFWPQILLSLPLI